MSRFVRPAGIRRICEIAVRFAGLRLYIVRQLIGGELVITLIHECQ